MHLPIYFHKLLSLSCGPGILPDTQGGQSQVIPFPLSEPTGKDGKVAWEHLKHEITRGQRQMNHCNHVKVHMVGKRSCPLYFPLRH